MREVHSISMLEQDIILLKDEVAYLHKAVKSISTLLKVPASQPNKKPAVASLVDIGTELESRGIKYSFDELKRIKGIISQYKLSDAQIRLTLDKIAIMYRKGGIHNLVGYVHSTFRHEHSLDRVGMDI
jgi:hypothetical protein